jgi:anti-sigma factor RsiW
MFAPYVDGAAEPDQRAAVDAHLTRCPPCRDRVSMERAAHEVVCARRETLRGHASHELKHRCAARRGAAAPPAKRGFIRTTLVPLSLAASVLLVATVLFAFFGRSVEVLAAQLAADHIKCFQFSSSSPAHADAQLLSREWVNTRGWSIHIPPSARDYGLELVGLRRCGSTDGITAHMMYKWRGAPLSVYVLNSESRHAPGHEEFVDTLGERAVIWKQEGRTYAVVADASRSELEPVIRYVKAQAR